jgi:hypothetical protein
MGMSYFVLTEDESSDTVNFTRELSDFFQGRFGYEDDSQVVQIEKLLNIDFELFYKINDPDEARTPIFINGHDLLNVINEFITKLESNSTIFSKVRMQEITDDRNIRMAQLQKEFMAAASAKDFEKTMALTKELSDFNKLPADTGYLKSGRLTKDLDEVRQGIEALLKQGKSKLKLYYM